MTPLTHRKTHRRTSSIRRRAAQPESARLVRALAAAALSALAIAAPTEAAAAPVWSGNFETDDLSQWSYVLNGEHISIVSDPVTEGKFAGHIQLTNDATWQNGLKRVELAHHPEAARTAEGAETYFAWSFQVPELLPEDPSQQIGYWESQNSYQQMMAFEVSGEHISFSTRKPQNKVQWEAGGKVTAGAWHRIAIHVKWSKDPGQGSVDVWFDGEQVVTSAGAQTLNDDNPHFTQIGLLRGAIEFQDSPIILLDDAVEGDTLEDVRPDAITMEGGTGGAGGGGGGGATSGSGGSAAQGGTSGSGGSESGSGGSGAEPDPSGDASTCGCRLVGQSDEGEGAAAAAMAGLFAALALTWRRRRA